LTGNLADSGQDRSSRCWRTWAEGSSRKRSSWSVPPDGFGRLPALRIGQP